MNKTITTTREYDSEGRLVRETIVEHVEPPCIPAPPYPYPYPYPNDIFPWQRQPLEVWCGTGTNSPPVLT